jgi:hypothetical protein
MASLCLFSGCESTSRREPPKPAAAVAPSSDVRRVKAWQDAELVASQDSSSSAAVGRGESMAPVFGDNTMLVFTQIPFEDLEPGMLVAYRNERGMQVVHRLVERTSRGAWRAQGINNPGEDRERVTRANYLGVVYASMVHEEREERKATGSGDRP